MRQRRWIELVKDYDCTISYQLGKANVVVEALGRNPIISKLHVSGWKLLRGLEFLEIEKERTLYQHDLSIHLSTTRVD